MLGTFPVPHWAPRLPYITRTGEASSSNSSSYNISFTTGGAPSAGKIVVIGVVNNSGSALTISGFTAVPGNTSSYGVFIKYTGGSEPSSYQINYGGQAKADRSQAVMVEINLAGATQPSNYTSTSGPNMAATISSAIHSLILSVALDTSLNTTYNTPPSGFTLSIRKSATVGNQMTAIAYKNQSSAGSTGTGAWDSGGGVTYTVIIGPNR